MGTATSTVEFAAGDWGLIIGPAGILQRSAPDAATQTTAWPKDAKASFTRDQALDGIRGAAPWLILLFAVLGLIFGFATAAVSVATIVAFNAFLLWLILKLLKRPIRYYEAVVLALYAATLPILVRVLFAWAGTATGMISNVLYWILLGFIARDIWKEKVGGKDLGTKSGNNA